MIRGGMLIFMVLVMLAGQAHGEPYPIVDSGQNACFGNSRQISCPDPGDEFNGQDAQYKGNTPKYRDNGDGTVSDLVTGLMWVKARGDKVSWDQAMDQAGECRVGGYSDWRMPTIKELYSLIDYNGWVQQDEKSSRPFIDTRYFDFKYGDTGAGERIIDCQDWSSSQYVSTTMGGARTAFGVNFADGRIKGYPSTYRREQDRKYVRYVRGNAQYGRNDFVNNNDGTVTDRATGLVWQQKDDGTRRNWEQALGYCENLTLAGRDDWRLPGTKELQSILDYTRSPATTDSSAIDPVFSYTDKEGWYWSSTTHLDGPNPSHACYLAFGRAMGYFAAPGSNGTKRYIDVHGAGAQRSDPKFGDPSRYPTGHGPQGDEIRINNYVRCVTGGGVEYYEPPYTRIPSFKGGSPHNQPGQSGQMMSPQGMRRDPNMGQGMGQGMPMGENQGMGQPMQPRRSGMRQGPPQEAFDACSGKSPDDGCTVQTPHGTLNGMCRRLPDGVACVPERGPGGPPRQ